MKTEIVNFIKDLPDDVHSYNLILDDGLYIIIDLDFLGNLLTLHKEVFDKKSNLTQFFQRCLDIQTNTKPVAATKIFNPNKKIFNSTCSPFAIGFKKKILEKNINDGTDISKELIQYFNAAAQYVVSEAHGQWLECFKSYCLRNLIETVRDLPEYKEGKADLSVSIFFGNPDLQDYKTVYENYVNDNVFNKDNYRTEWNGTIYNIADSLSSFSDKKMFWKHKTAPFELNLRILAEEAKSVWQFFELQRRKVLPNPLPIFIDKRELNESVIRLTHEYEKITYSEILKRIFQEPGVDIGSYYLFFFQKGKIVDLDFVPSFEYGIEGMNVRAVFHLGEKVRDKMITDIFQFEKEVANKIFNGQLTSETKNGVWLRYFGDVDYNPKYLTHNTYNQLLRYRMAFYEFVYKSKRQGLTQTMFHDILLQGIIDDLRYHQFESTDGYWVSEYSIKEKLNIWFSLYSYFENDLSKSIDMINKTETLRKRIGDIAKGEGLPPHIENDEEFAFASGQVIYWILLQSESANRTHALLEPFIQKTEAKLLKESIARTFDMYKHKFTLYPTKYEFDKIFGQVMGCDTKANMKTLIPFLLAGYFSDSVFKRS